MACGKNLGKHYDYDLAAARTSDRFMVFIGCVFLLKSKGVQTNFDNLIAFRLSCQSVCLCCRLKEHPFVCDKFKNELS